MQIHPKRNFSVFIIIPCIMFVYSFSTITWAVDGVGLKYQRSYGIYYFNKTPALGLSISGISHPLLNIQPKNFKRTLTIDSTGIFIEINEEIAGYPVYLPARVTKDYYFSAAREHHLQLQWQKYKVEHFEDDFKKQSEGRGLAIDIPVKIKSKAFQTIFGGDRVGLSVTGNITINGGFRHEKRSQVRTAINRGSDYNFKMEQTQRFRVTGNVGEKVKVSVDQDSERPFDFENTIKLNYDGYEDEIIKKIEAGNISLSLPATRFVSFSGKNSGLFGLKSEMTMGNLNVTMIASQEKGENKKLTFTGGAQEGTQQIKDINFIKNQYFFLDEYYRNSYFPLDEATGLHNFDPFKRIMDIDVYISTSEQDEKRIYGYAAADTAHIFDETFEVTKEHVMGYWARLEPTEYYVNNDLGFIKLNTRVDDATMLAVAYRDSSSRVPVGELNFNIAEGDTVINLKLLKSDKQQPSDRTWDLMFRHIYYLGARNIDEEGFEAKILYQPPSGDPQETISTESGGVKSYLAVFGLDRVDEVGNDSPDNKIDNNENILRLSEGELEFPSLEPFNDSTSVYFSDLNKGEGDNKKIVSAMYNTTSNTEITKDSKFYIEIKSKSRSATMQLGWNVIEGSEEVRVNGRLLTKGSDYIIDYYSGSLTILDESAASPSADVEITYQRNELFQLEKKTLLGLRAEYDLWENSFIGGTFLYLNQRTLDQKVRVGKGPSRNMIWDLNTKLSFTPNFLTKAVDALPLIQTKQESKLDFEGEIAQILPNPNTLNNEKTKDNDGVAYIDDFEAVKKITPLGVTQGGWTLASPPLIKQDNNPKSVGPLAKLYWYNPYEMVRIQEIWPNREVNANTPQTVHVLNMVFDHREEEGMPPKSLDQWAGIMRPLSSGYADQSESKFIEVWIKGNSGRLHIDLGQITEDVIPNKRLDTEDEMVNGIRNKLLDPNEDIGIDGMQGADPTDYWDINKNGIKDAGEPTSDDDWAYNPNASTYEKAYGKTNGTEGNKNNVNGTIPDTEDINGNGTLDQVNNYFEYSFSLDKEHSDSAKYIVGSNATEGEKPTWYQYRIPLAEQRSKVGTPDMTRLEFARVWVDSIAEGPITISIAEINIVGNDWKEKGVAARDDTTYVLDDDSTVVATVINTHDNPEYDAPPGVSGVRDRITRVEAKEQSLVIRVKDLPPGHNGILQKTFYQAEDYINYKKMKMFVHGDDNLPEYLNKNEDPPETPIELFLRFGANDNNYYEIRKPVYKGWDVEVNNFEIDLPKLTQLKNQIADTLENGRTVREEIKENKEVWRVVGEPALRNVKQLVIGIKNSNDTYYSGEVWVNELRLSEVFKDKGFAMRARVDLKLADVFSINAEVNRKDADFHDVNTRFGTGNNQLSYNINTGLQLHKFLPRSWGLSLPVTFNWKKSESTPKYVSGSDILVSELNKAEKDSVIEQISSLSENYGYQVSFRKTTKSNNFFIKNTLDNLNISFNSAESKSSNSTTEKQTQTTYNANVSYRINFDTKAHVRPFWFIGDLPVIKKLGELKFYYFPTDLSLNASGNQTKNYSLTRTGLENESRPFTINRSAQTGYKPFTSLSFDFSRSHKSDLTRIEKPKDELLKGKFGELTNVDQSASAKYNPKIFSWLTSNFTYTTGYKWSNNLQNKTAGRSASNNSSMNGSFSFDPDRLIKSLTKPSKKKPPTRDRKKPGEKLDDERPNRDEKDNKKGLGLNPFKKFMKGIGFVTKTLQPISINYTQRNNKSYSGLEPGNPTWGFMFGFEDSTGVPLVPNLGTNRGTFTNSDNLSLQSGLKISRNVDLTLRFSHDNSRNETTQITGNTSSSSFRIGEDKDPFPFPEWSLRWTGLEKIAFFKNLIQRMSIDHSFTGKTTESWQKNANNLTSKSYDANFRPLCGFNITWKNNISTTVRFNKGSTFNESTSSGNGRRSSNSDFSIQGKYSRSGGFRIPIPVWPFKNKEFKNNIDLSFQFSLRDDVSEQNVKGGKWEEMDKTSKWSLKPELSYRFSDNVSGGMHFEYGKNDSKRMGKTSFQDFGLNVRIEIRGR